MSRMLCVVLVALLAAAGCRDDVATGLSKAELDAERARVKAQIARRAPGKAAAEPTKSAKGAEGESGSFGEMDEQFTYTATGRRDPFQPYRVESTLADEVGAGPLEQFELEQLSVVALVWDGAKARAMVADPSGTTYTIGVGSRMGKNAGRVIHIGDNLVLVKETYVDYAGDESTKDVELRIRRSEGG